MLLSNRIRGKARTKEGESIYFTDLNKVDGETKLDGQTELLHVQGGGAHPHGLCHRVPAVVKDLVIYTAMGRKYLSS